MSEVVEIKRSVEVIEFVYNGTSYRTLGEAKQAKFFNETDALTLIINELIDGKIRIKSYLNIHHDSPEDLPYLIHRTLDRGAVSNVLPSIVTGICEILSKKQGINI